MKNKQNQTKEVVEKLAETENNNNSNKHQQRKQEE